MPHNEATAIPDSTIGSSEVKNHIHPFICLWSTQNPSVGKLLSLDIRLKDVILFFLNNIRVDLKWKILANQQQEKATYSDPFATRKPERK
jgi:hypothetical protein